MHLSTVTRAHRQQHEDYLRNRRQIDSGVVRFRTKKTIEALRFRRILTPLQKRLITEELSALLEGVFSDLLAEKQVSVEIDTIQRAVSACYRKSVEAFCAVSRKHDILRPRWVSMYLSRKHTNHSYSEIARRHGGKDHSVALFSVRQVALLVGDTTISQPAGTPVGTIDQELCGQIALLRKTLGI